MIRFFSLLVCMLLAHGAYGQSQQCPQTIQAKVVSAATYTVQNTDNCQFVVLTAATAINVKLPAPGLIFPPQWKTTLVALNGGTITFTGLPDDAGRTHLINNVSTTTFSPGAGAVLQVLQDFNWWGVPTGVTGTVYLGGPSPAASLGAVALFNGGFNTRGGGPLPRVSVMDQSYGAVCDGATDDLAAIQTAINEATAAGLGVTSNNRVCGVAGRLDLQTGADVAELKLKQLTPDASASVRTIYYSGPGPITLTNVKVDRGSNATACGSVADCAGIYLSGTFGGAQLKATLRNVEVTGDGPGQGVVITDADGVTLDNVYIHDMRWTAGSDPGTEQIVGLSLIRAVNVYSDGLRIEDLNGQIGAGAMQAYQTDCLDLTAAQRATFVGSRIARCAEGLDAGNVTDVWMIGTQYTQTGGWFEKWRSPINSGSIGSTAYKPGNGLIVGSIADGASPGATSLRIVDAMVRNPGDGCIVGCSPISGFRLDAAAAGAVEPVDIVCSGCSAIDTSGSMDYGFLSTVDGASQPVWKLTNAPYTSGFITAWGHQQGVDFSYVYGTPPAIATLASPADGGTVNIAAGDGVEHPAVIVLAGAYAALSVVLPECNTAMDGRFSSFTLSNTVAALAVTANGGAPVNGAPTTAGAAWSKARFYCRSAVPAYYPQ